MIDLFGLGRAPQEPPQPHDASADTAPAEAAPPRGSHRVWGGLLVLDSLLIIVFAGVAAFKVSQYWRAPAPPPPAARRRPAPKPPEPVKPPEPPKPAEAPKPAAPPAEAVKAPEPPKPAPKRAEAPRPPKPSLLAEGPKPHAAPGLAAAAAPHAAPPAEGKAKAQAVVFKLRAPDARAVQLVGAFIVHGGRKEMTKGSDGTWTLKLYLNPGQYRYFFSADKKKLLDPDNPRADRGASVMSVP